jgi:hypothetical protein
MSYSSVHPQVWYSMKEDYFECHLRKSATLEQTRGAVGLIEEKHLRITIPE